MNRIKDKIDEIFKYVEELEDILPSGFEEYQNNNEKKAACERYFEKIIEAIIDLAHLTIKHERLTLPNEDIKAFEILSQRNIITKELCDKMQEAKGMRNILAHKYGEINDEIVFEALTQQIIKDTDDFIKLIEKKLK